MSKESCRHPVSPENRQVPERFLRSGKKYTLEEVLAMPIELAKMPHEYNTLSPTPLDPDSLTIHGMPYAPQALDFLLHKLAASTEGLKDSNPQQLQSAEAEVTYQHDHRMQKNAGAMDAWKEVAATDPNEQKLTHADAEGLIQVRAGIARPSAVIELLARNPQMGGIEVAKATRPFCMSAHVLARTALFQELAASRVVNSVPGGEAMPYRIIIDERNITLITKTKVASAALNGVEIEVVNRESGVLYNPATTAPIPESMEKEYRGVPFSVAPLDITSYVRVKQD